MSDGLTIKPNLTYLPANYHVATIGILVDFCPYGWGISPLSGPGEVRDGRGRFGLSGNKGTRGDSVHQYGERETDTLPASTVDHLHLPTASGERAASPSDGIRDVRSFVTLDGLRGAAALSVALYHLSLAGSQPPLPSAYLAVDLFFLLSGFVIAHAYSRRLATSLSPFAFMKLRLIRLYPVYIFGTAILIFSFAAAVATGKANHWTAEYLGRCALASAVFLPCHEPASYGDALFINSPAWSLFWELLINAVYAVAFRWLSGRVLWAVLIVSALAILGLAFHDGGLDGGSTWAQLYAGGIRVTFSFTAGVLLHSVMRRQTFSLPRISPLALVIVCTAIFFVPARGVWRPIFDIFCVFAVFPAIVATAVRNEPKGHATRRMFVNIGLLSYPIYMIHWPIWILSLKTVSSTPGAVSGQQEFVLRLASVAVILIIAWVMATKIDPVARRWLSQVMHQPTPGIPKLR